MRTHDKPNRVIIINSGKNSESNLTNICFPLDFNGFECFLCNQCLIVIKAIDFQTHKPGIDCCVYVVCAVPVVDSELKNTIHLYSQIILEAVIKTPVIY